jgi:hypothetical protein
VAKQHRGWGGKRKDAGRPPGKRKLTQARRDAVARDYVARVDIAESDYVQRRRPYRQRFIRELARKYRISRRMVVTCIVEFGVRRIRADNKKFLKSNAAKKKPEIFQADEVQKS